MTEDLQPNKPVDTLDWHLWFIQCQCRDGLFFDGSEALSLLRSCSQKAGFTPLKGVSEEFPQGKTTITHQSPDTRSKGGMTAVVLLAESHLAMHSWPEFSRSIKIDISVCNYCSDNRAKLERLKELLISELAPQSVIAVSALDTV